MEELTTFLTSIGEEVEDAEEGMFPQHSHHTFYSIHSPRVDYLTILSYQPRT